MKKKILSLMIFFIIIMTCGCTVKSRGLANSNQVNSEISTVAETVTVKQMADYLQGKKEHYPLSDEFIERYQQSSGGYLDKDQEVNKELHSPNQKWHFFESWLYPSIEDGTLTWDADAKSKVYTRLLCPELLLWMYEACEVSPSKVREAKLVAEQAKVNGTHISTMAKNMRACVPWEDLAYNIINNVGESDSGSDAAIYSVDIATGEGFNITGLKSGYEAGSNVSFVVSITAKDKQIDKVMVEGVTVELVSSGKYKFVMPEKDVVINVILKDKEVIIPVEGLSVSYDIDFDMGTRKTSKLLTIEELLPTFVVEGDNDIINEITEANYIYGGGYGGSGENKWVAGNMLKFGTTSAVGEMTLSLNGVVNRVIIQGYVADDACKIQIGDATSTDWLGSSGDNKTTIYTCTGVNEVSKSIVEGNQTSTITIDFEETSELKIRVNNKKPLYITNIQFLYVEE